MSPKSRSGVSRRRFLIGSSVTGVAALAGCVQQRDGGGSGGGGGNGSEGGGTTTAGGDLSGEINIAGSSTVFPLTEAMAEQFQRKHSGVSISVQSTGTGGGFSNYFCTGQTVINDASRPISEAERQQCQENGVTPIELQVATDALTVVVNNAADWVDCLTVDELAQIWRPDNPAQTWSDVRPEWPDEEFALYGAASTSGTFDYFTEAVMGEEGAHRQDYQPTENDSTIVTGVQGSEYAMGYFGFSYYSNNPDTVKALAIDDGDGCVSPSLETAASGEYQPLSRPLFVYPAREALAQEHVAEFCRFYLENAASEEIIAEDVGYVPLTDSQQQEQMDALESAIEGANA